MANGIRAASTTYTIALGQNAVNEPIDSRKLQIFICLANKGSLKAAAPELSLTCSAVSHAISSLEASLGVQLFHRSGKGLVLTEKGEYLHRKAIPLVAQMNNIRVALTGEGVADRTSLRVAAAFSFVSYVAPDVVREFNECFPRGRITIRAAERETSLQLLRDREVDVAIVVDPPEDGSDFTYTRLFEDELKLLLHARNPLAGLEIVPMSSLASKTLIVSRAQSHTIRTLSAHLRKKNLEFRECIEVGSTEALIEMVKIGQGVALLPEWIVQRASQSPLLTLRPLEGMRFQRVWASVGATWALPNLAGRTFCRLCRQAVAAYSPVPVRQAS